MYVQNTAWKHWITIYDGLDWVVLENIYEIMPWISSEIFFLGYLRRKVKKPWRWKVYRQRFVEKRSGNRQWAPMDTSLNQKERSRRPQNAVRCAVGDLNGNICHWNARNSAADDDPVTNRAVLVSNYITTLWSGWRETYLRLLRALVILIYMRTDLSRGLVRNSRGRARCEGKWESLSTRITNQRQSGAALGKSFSLFVLWSCFVPWNESHWATRSKPSVLIFSVLKTESWA